MGSRSEQMSNGSRSKCYNLRLLDDRSWEPGTSHIGTRKPGESAQLNHHPGGVFPLSAPKSQRCLRFAIAMPIADPRNRAISETRDRGSVPTPVHVGTPGNGELVCLVFVCPDAARGCPVAVWFMSSQLYCTGLMLASRLRSGTRVFGVFAFC